MASVSALVVVRHSPVDVTAAEEGLRIAVGLTLGFSDVSVLLVDEAVTLVSSVSSPTFVLGQALRHWATLGELGVRRLVEHESLAKRGLADANMPPSLEVIPRAEVARVMAAADTVAVF